MPILDKTSGQILEYRQLRKHPKFVHIWNTSYVNETGQLCQGVGKGSKGPKKYALREQTLSASFDLKISLVRDERKFATTQLCVKYDLKRKIPIVHASPSMAATSVILEI